MPAACAARRLSPTRNDADTVATMLAWQEDLETGVDVIDGQHRRIVDMINQLEAARRAGVQATTMEVLDGLVDYTLSHFAFEESLMEQAGYPFSAAHRRVHEVFARRVQDYRLRFEAGEDILDELRAMLSRWLFNHIRGDDKAYSETVKRHLDAITRSPAHAGWLGRTMQRLFH